MHSLQEILAETRKTSNLCCAVEKGGVICFTEKAPRNKYCHKHLGRYRKYKSFDLPIKIKKKCKFIDCNKKYERGGYCGLHYSNIWSAKKRNSPKSDLEKCLVEDCNNKNYVRGYCNKHYLKLIRFNDPNYKQKRNNGKNHPNVLGRRKHKKCIAPGCEEISEKPNSIIKGLCVKHYGRWRKYKSFSLPEKIQLKCSSEGCTNKYHCKGYCNLHYDRWKAHGDCNIVYQKGRKIKK